MSNYYNIRLIGAYGAINGYQLEKWGWTHSIIFDFEKEIELQDLDGARYTYKIGLRQDDDHCLIFINDVWIGRVWRVYDVNRICEALKIST